MPSPSKPHLLVIGSANTDLVVHASRLPGPGETVLGGEFSEVPGGKGANQALAAALAGAQVDFVARVGTDALGTRMIDNLLAAGIGTRHMRRDASAPSGVALITVNTKGENAIVVAGGANTRLTPGDIDEALPLMRRAAVLLLQLETPLPTVEHAARLARKAGCLVLLNPAPATTLPDSLLHCVDVLTPNEHEAALLTGRPVRGVKDARNAARTLRGRGAGVVIITLGASGVFVSAPDHEDHEPGFTVKAVDSTAAGDVFNGALALRLAEKAPLRDAVRFAQAAAAISVTRPGAQTSIPLRREIEAFLGSHA
jgi:ribokinase